MFSVSKALFVLVALVCTQSSATVCPKGCFCQNETIQCRGNALKEPIPESITEANLAAFYPEAIGNVSKVHKTWASVTKLQIFLLFPSSVMYLADRCFEGLKNLSYLGIHGITPTKDVMDFFFNVETFYGLNNLKILDLSGNSFLYLKEVTKSLEKTNILPDLKVIILKDLQSQKHQPIYRYESSKFLDVLQTRRIEELILDGAEFEIDFSYMRNLCTSLKVLSMKYSRVFGLHRADYFACSSLQELDLMNASVPFLEFLLKIPLIHVPSFVSNFNRYVPFLFSVETLNLNNFLSQVPKPLSFDSGWTFDATGIIFNVKYLSFRNNFLKNFNVTFRHMSFPKGTDIDVSDNNIEYIHPKSIDPGSSIRRINLAGNNLYKMERNYPADFAIFLHIFTDLEDINLSYNSILSLPRYIFSKNVFLKSVNVSGNMIHLLSIDLQPLLNLQYLDVSENRLTTLSNSQMIELEKHASNYDTFGRNDSFVLNLDRNKFICDCERLSFIKWFKRTGFLGERYLCVYGSKKYDMKNDAVEQVTKACDLKMLKRNLIIGLNVSFFLIFVTVLSIILFHRYRKKQNKIKSYLSSLRKKDESHFLAFLSYCSEDTGFVLSQLANKLNDELCIKTKRKAEYICIGDKHFRPGFPVITEIMSKMENSAVAIFVISQMFCDKSWCHIEVREAMDLQKPIVLVFKEEVDEAGMPKLIKRLFRQNTRCKFVHDEDLGWRLQPSWDVLTSSIIELAAKSETLV